MKRLNRFLRWIFLIVKKQPYIDKEGGKNAINYLSDESLESLDIDLTFQNMINPSQEENIIEVSQGSEISREGVESYNTVFSFIWIMENLDVTVLLQ